MSEKIEQILTNFKDEAKKHKTFGKNFIVRLIKIIEKNKAGFIKNEWMDTKVNKYLMNTLDDKFNLNFIKGSVNQLDVNKFDEIKDFLTNKGK